MSFLCPQHLETFSKTPKLALSNWKNFIDNGENALEQGKLKKALTYIGSAFDISQLLLNQSRNNHCLSALDRFLYTANRLIQLYRKLTEYEQAKSLCASVHCYLVECHSCLISFPLRQQVLLERIDRSKHQLQAFNMIH